jgi:hypothetical protein
MNADDAEYPDGMSWLLRTHIRGICDHPRSSACISGPCPVCLTGNRSLSVNLEANPAENTLPDEKLGSLFGHTGPA